MMDISSTSNPQSQIPVDHGFKQAQEGDRQAFEQVVQRTESLARKTAYPLLYPHQVDDAVQEAYLVVFQKIHHLRKPEAFQAWLCRIVLHVCYALKKKCPPTEELNEQAGVADSTLAVDNQSMIRQALSQLSEDCRNVLILREFLHLDYEEISFALNLPLGTVRSRLHYGRKKLEKILTS